MSMTTTEISKILYLFIHLLKLACIVDLIFFFLRIYIILKH